MATYQGQKIPTSYATCSIGHKKEHNLAAKLKAIAQAGFEAIELSMPDILSYGQEVTGKEVDPKDYSTLVEVGKKIAELCKENGLKILMLQPFAVSICRQPTLTKGHTDAYRTSKAGVKDPLSGRTLLIERRDGCPS
jgi:sugar phosphate isomerase/epimerase